MSDRAWATAAALSLGAVAAIRLLLLFASPVELYPDEAQYWAWSRILDWGYFSKPPMIAWLIASSTSIGGDDEAWVRLPAWFCQTGAGAFVFLAGRRLFDARVGFWAAVLYALAPGVMLSSGVASTDAPLLLFLAAATWAYAALVQRGGAGWAAALGLLLGLAVLSKYAAAYYLLGLAAHAIVSVEARRRWTPRALTVALAAGAACLAPNLAWNAAHGFDTLEHTAANASWDTADLLHPGELLSFIGSQFGVLGPVPFAALTIGLVALAWRRRAQPAEVLLICLLAPPLLLVAMQALLSRANANWAAAFLPAGAILAARWLGVPQRSARAGLLMALSSQTAVQAVVAVALVSPSAADALGLANGLKRARGWAATAVAVRSRVVQEGGSARLTALAVDDRFVFNALRYYGREWVDDPAYPPLRAWVREASPQNQAEATSPLTIGGGGRVLGIGVTADYLGEFRADFRATSAVATVAVPLDRRRTRDLRMFVGEGFAPRER